MTTQNKSIWTLEGRFLEGQKRRAQTTVSLLKPAKNDTVLDVGCAEGYVTSFLTKADYIVGLDTSRESLLLARSHVKKSNVDFIWADAAHLPFVNNAFSKITMLEVLEHLPGATQIAVCKEVNSVLKPEGVAVVSTPYKENIEFTQCVHCGKMTPLWGHLEVMDEEKIIAAFPNAYELLKRYHIVNFPFVSLSWFSSKLHFGVWIGLNNLLGRVSRGYWIMLSLKKQST